MTRLQIFPDTGVVLSMSILPVTFHTKKAKGYWKRHGIQIESLYGLLYVFDRRQRKPPRRTR